MHQDNDWFSVLLGWKHLAFNFFGDRWHGSGFARGVCRSEQQRHSGRPFAGGDLLPGRRGQQSMALEHQRRQLAPDDGIIMKNLFTLLIFLCCGAAWAQPHRNNFATTNQSTILTNIVKSVATNVVSENASGASQTPWTGDIAAAFHSLTAAATLVSSNSIATNSANVGSNGVAPPGIVLNVEGAARFNGTLSVSNSLAANNLISMSITSDNAAAGNIGEYVESLIASGSATALTTATAKNVTSISLTAGDWDVSGNVNFAATTATVTGTSGGISSTSATVPTDGSEVFSGVQVTLVSENDSVTLPRKRFSLSGTTTVYLIAKSTFSAGSVSAFGQINARRAR